MKILLAGTPHTTVMIADAIVVAGHTVVGVICPFPKPVGRRKIVTACDVELWAHNRHISVFNVDKMVLSDKSFLKALPLCDVLVVADFGYLIPAWLLGYPSHGAFNLHPSLLPRWRGATPVPFTLLFGDTETGISLIKMNEKFDMGDVVAQEHVEVKPEDTTPILLERCFSKGAQLLVNMLPSIELGKITPIPQPDMSPVPVTRKFTKDDGFVPLEALRAAMRGADFSEIAVGLLDEYGLPHTAQCVDQMVRALTPWPGVWTMKDGKRVKILKSQLTDKKTLNVNQIQPDGVPPKNIGLFD